MPAPELKLGPYYFGFKIWYHDNTPELFYKTSNEKELRLLFDPNKMDYSTPVSIEEIQLSPDNSTLSLTLAKNGGDWRYVVFIDMGTEKFLTDSLNFLKFSNVIWYKKGVLYSGYRVKTTEESFRGIIKNKGLYYHKMGTKQDEDKLIYSYPDSTNINFDFFPKEGFVTEQHYSYHGNKRYNTLSVSDLNDSMQFHFKDIIITPYDTIDFHVLGRHNGQLIVESNLNDPNGTVYSINPKLHNELTELIPPNDDQLTSALLMDNKIICAYSNDSLSYLSIFDSTGKRLHYTELPPGFTLDRLTVDPDENTLYYSFESFLVPRVMYSLNLNTYKDSAIGKPAIYYDYKNFTTKKIRYKSKDGTQIPMYLVYKKGLKFDGTHPVILYGYGGFGIKTEPVFNPANILFMNNGGVFAAPCLRGGGDYPGWHKKGMRLKKQKTFDDYIAAAEYLIAHKYTSTGKIAALGGSNGGLVVATAMLQRPELFKVVVSISGLFDMMRYHLYNIGYEPVYRDEFGNIKDSVDFKNLLSYSPLQNVKQYLEYPPTLLVAGDNDDRVNPFHSFKFLATLQANAMGKNPHVLYYQEKAGHNGAGNQRKQEKMWVAVYSFIFRYLDMEDKMFYNEVYPDH